MRLSSLTSIWPPPHDHGRLSESSADVGVTDTVVDPNGDRLPIPAVVPESVSIAGGRNRSPGRAGPGVALRRCVARRPAREPPWHGRSL